MNRPVSNFSRSASPPQTYTLRQTLHKIVLVTILASKRVKKLGSHRAQATCSTISGRSALVMAIQAITRPQSLRPTRTTNNSTNRNSSLNMLRNGAATRELEALSPWRTGRTLRTPTPRLLPLFKMAYCGRRRKSNHRMYSRHSRSLGLRRRDGTTSPSSPSWSRIKQVDHRR